MTLDESQDYKTLSRDEQISMQKLYEEGKVEVSANGLYLTDYAEGYMACINEMREEDDKGFENRTFRRDMENNDFFSSLPNVSSPEAIVNTERPQSDRISGKHHR